MNYDKHKNIYLIQVQQYLILVIMVTDIAKYGSWLIAQDN